MESAVYNALCSRMMLPTPFPAPAATHACSICKFSVAGEGCKVLISQNAIEQYFISNKALREKTRINVFYDILIIEDYIR